MRRGAQERGENLTDFIIRSACAEAEQALADQRRFALDAEQWNAFVAALDRPVQPKPRLRRLFTEPSVVEKQRAGRTAEPVSEAQSGAVAPPRKPSHKRTPADPRKPS